VGGANKEK
jgi:chromosome segregation ATPase